MQLSAQYLKSGASFEETLGQIIGDKFLEIDLACDISINVNQYVIFQGLSTTYTVSCNRNLCADINF